jgi:hypothetical protein
LRQVFIDTDHFFLEKIIKTTIYHSTANLLNKARKILDFVISFLVGFIGVWLALTRVNVKSIDCKYKEPMVKIAKMYGCNKKISKELKIYSMYKIRNGNYEYIEVIDIIKRLKNDKARA